MIPKPRHVVLICEDGWEGIREFSLMLSAYKIPVSAIIKGAPGPEVKQMISPKPWIRNYFFSRGVYRMILFPLLIGLYGFKRWNICCVTKERTYKAIKRLGKCLRSEVYLFQESGKNSYLVLGNGKNGGNEHRVSLKEALLFLTN